MEQPVFHRKATAMTTAFLYSFIKKYSLTVASTVGPANAPQSAVIGFIVTEDLKLFFDTRRTSRKFANLLTNPNMAFVFGWDAAQTVQYEGRARTPGLKELGDLLPAYFKAFPEGKERSTQWKDICYLVVDPVWIRFSDFVEPVRIEEMRFDQPAGEGFLA